MPDRTRDSIWSRLTDYQRSLGADESADAFRDKDGLAWTFQLPLLRRLFAEDLHIGLTLLHEVRAGITDKLFLNGLQNARRSLGLRGSCNE
jgi:hypothetical protein